MRAMRLIRRSIVTAAALVCAIVAVPLVAVAAAAHLHHPAFTMATGSMAPWARPGDLRGDRGEPASQRAVGQVLTFHPPVAGSVWTSHRVVSIRDVGGDRVVTTKGDANAEPDARALQMPAGARLAVSASVVRHGGTVVTWAHGSGGRRLLGLSVFVLVLALLWPRRPQLSSGAEAVPA